MISLYTIIFSLFFCGIYLILQGSLIRTILAYIILGNAVNLSIFRFSNINREVPPFYNDTLIKNLNYSDPLPQAFILTAIVIGFGITIHLAFLAMRAHQQENSDKIDIYKGEDE